jgi:light-regulated signal transduction histidine kinase (bacteriophytochrome)
LGSALGSDAVLALRNALADPRSSGRDPITLDRGTEPSLDLTWHRSDSLLIVEVEPSGVMPQASVGQLFAAANHSTQAIQNARGIAALCEAAATEIRALTGYDRVMVYRFHPDWHGEVVADSHVPELESFLGLHYPASDIPRQARELYRRNWLRTIPDIEYQPAPLQPALNPRTGETIDMSHCALRSVSPIHVEYLRNMGVCASMSASIVCQDRLWGMLVLHHYAPRQVSADLRMACEAFAQIFSLHVDAKSQAETSVSRLHAQGRRDELARQLEGAPDLGAAIASWDLLGYVGASGAIVQLDGQAHAVGVTPPPAEVATLVAWLNTLNLRLYSTEQLAREHLPAEAYCAIASGLLAVGLSREPRDYVLWFRPEIGRTVRWAGNPAKQVKVDRHGVRLTPRGSFAEWLEVTHMQSAAWSTVDLEAAEALRVILLENVLKRIDNTRRQRAFEAARSMAEELERRVTERTEQLRLLASDLEAAEDRERRQVARDLHDDLGQTLAAARIRLAVLCEDPRTEVQSKANEVGRLIDDASRSIRSLAAQLAPAVLNELGIGAALDWLGDEIGRIFGLKVTVIDDGSPKLLDQDARSIVYRAARELLINVAKHAGTDAATIASETRGNQLRVRVSDRGKGYVPGAVAAGSPRGLGLISVRERLSLIGGTAEIGPNPGGGTLGVLTVPLSRDRESSRDRNP